MTRKTASDWNRASARLKNDAVSRIRSRVGGRAVQFAILLMGMTMFLGAVPRGKKNVSRPKPVSETAPSSDDAAQPVVLFPYWPILGESEIKISPTDDYREFVDQCRPLTPFLVGMLSCPEGFSSHVYKDGRGIPTIGYGTTRTPNGRVTMHTPNVTKEQAYEYSRWHLEDYETDFILYCYCVAFNRELTVGEYLGLASFVYNGGANMMEPNADKKSNFIRNERWTLMFRLYREQGNITRDQVLEHFAKYPIVSEGSVCAAWRNGEDLEIVGDNMTNYLSGGRGLRWRRWIEACVLAGRISPRDLFDCPVGGIYEFQKYMRNVHKAELIDRETRTVNYDAADVFLEWINNRQYWDSRHKRLYKAPAKEETIHSVLPQHIADEYEAMLARQAEWEERLARYNEGIASVRYWSAALDESVRNTMSGKRKTGKEI